MAHELDTLADGVTAAYVGRQTAWHQLGTVIPDRCITFSEALELGGADFPVETREVFWKQPVNGDPDDTFMAPVGVGRATVRMDRNEVLGLVGNDYTPLQNRIAFGALEPLVDAGVARIETAGTVRAGADVWLQVRFELDDPKVRECFTERADGDRIVPYALISNNHTGARKAMIQESPVRTVCANTLAMAQSGFNRRHGFKVRHTMNVEQKVTEAAQELFKNITARYRVIAEQYDLLRMTHLDTALFRRLVLDVAAPVPEKLQEVKLTRRQETSLEKVQDRRERLALLWTEGDGHKGDYSAWEAYNGVAQSIDHDADLWKLGEGERRLRSMFDGRAASMKEQVLDGLVSFAAEA